MTQLDETIRHNLAKYNGKEQELIERLLLSLYVDDLSSERWLIDTAYKVYQRSKQIFGNANMNIRKWKTDYPQLAERIKTAEGTKNPSTEVISEDYVKFMLNPTDS